MSPESSARRSAQCSTCPPSKWPPQRISVSPPPSSCVSPSQKRDRRIRPHHPLPLGLVQVDRAAERVRPLDHRAVVVRMRDRDRGEAALAVDALDELVVEERDAVPEDVAGRALDEQRALADRERRRAADAEHAAVVADVGLVVVDEVLPAQPDLPVVVRDVLPRVLADRAGARRLVGGGYCVAARLAEVVVTAAPARAARRTRRAACAGTCRPGARASAGSRSRRASRFTSPASVVGLH